MTTRTLVMIAALLSPVMAPSVGLAWTHEDDHVRAGGPPPGRTLLPAGVQCKQPTPSGFAKLVAKTKALFARPTKSPKRDPFEWAKAFKDVQPW